MGVFGHNSPLLTFSHKVTFLCSVREVSSGLRVGLGYVLGQGCSFLPLEASSTGDYSSSPINTDLNRGHQVSSISAQSVALISEQVRKKSSSANGLKSRFGVSLRSSTLTFFLFIPHVLLSSKI